MCLQWRFKPVCVSAQFDLSLISLPEETLDPWLHKECPSKTLIRLCKCAGWSESSIVAHANLYPLLETSSVNLEWIISKYIGTDRVVDKSLVPKIVMCYIHIDGAFNLIIAVWDWCARERTDYAKIPKTNLTYLDQFCRIVFLGNTWHLKT